MGDPRSTDDGFTLIELLVVIIIIGILASIAVPTFLGQREKAFRTQAISDMKNAAIAIESYSSDFGGDYSAVNGATQATPVLAEQGFNSSEWVSVKVVADRRSYCILGVNSKVPGKQFVLRSDNGLLSVTMLGSPSC